MQKHWDFNRRRIALLNRAGWQIGWIWLHIHWEISLHTDLKKKIKRCIYSLAPCLCNAITLEASALTIHKVGAGRPLIDVSSKFMPTNFHSISLRSKPGLLASQCFCMCIVGFFFFLRITLMSGLLLLMTERALLMSPKGRNASRDGLV